MDNDFYEDYSSRMGEEYLEREQAANENFYLKVAYALSGCQLVEQELKLYITEALELAKKCIGSKMPFKLKGEDYADSSLEKLITIFKKLSDNDALGIEFGRFKDERNFLAHKAITQCLDYDRELSEITPEVQDRLENIQKEARRLRDALHLEFNEIRGHLYFDAITDPQQGIVHKPSD